jgi:hypothetical protein
MENINFMEFNRVFNIQKIQNNFKKIILKKLIFLLKGQRIFECIFKYVYFLIIKNLILRIKKF